MVGGLLQVSGETRSTGKVKQIVLLEKKVDVDWECFNGNGGGPHVWIGQCRACRSPRKYRQKIPSSVVRQDVAVVASRLALLHMLHIFFIPSVSYFLCFRRLKMYLRHH